MQSGYFWIMFRGAFLVCIFSWAFCGWSQSVPLGHWRGHFPYRQATALAAGDGQVYCATPFSLFSISLDDHALTRYSKVNGLHDAGISAIGFHESTRSLVIAYDNSNLDVLQDGNIINIPDIRLRPVPGDKRIRQIAFHGFHAYLSTGIGIITLDLEKHEITDTYTAGDVHATAVDGPYLYAAAADGIRRGLLQGSNLADPANWTDISSGLGAGAVTAVAQSGGQLFCLRGDSVYILQNDQWQRWFGNGQPIQRLRASGNVLFAIQQGRVLELHPETNTFRDAAIPHPADALITGTNIWFADAENGLVEYDGTYRNYTPNAPRGIVTGEMAIIGGSLWAAAGSVSANWQATGNRNGLYRFAQEEWINYTFPDSLQDIITVAEAGGAVYAGAFGGGVISLSGNGQYTVEKPSPPHLISGLAADKAGNLWVSAFGSPENLLVKKPDNSWLAFRIPLFHLSNAVSQILVDDADQKWIVSPRNNGVFVFNHGSSLEQTADDQWKLYQTGAGRGNLPSADVRCLAKDRSGWIWIGTARGVAVVQCPLQQCDAYLPVVKQDNFAGYLFQNEQVNTIAVDGANRKWVGTQNGAWLISADGEKILQYFNVSNSPLSSNIVHRIIVHPVSGEVFFATATGLLSWRGTATEGSTTQGNDVLVFPNPVPRGYEGTIAIRGLVHNAMVKITDVTGKLVYQTRASGGQAVWNGRDYTGHRPQSGVYLVFSADDTGREKLVTKLVFIH